MIDQVGGTLMKGASGLTKAMRGLAHSLFVPFHQTTSMYKPVDYTCIRNWIPTKHGACWHLYFSNTGKNMCLLLKPSSPSWHFCCNVLNQHGHCPTVLMAYNSSTWV